MPETPRRYPAGMVPISLAEAARVLARWKRMEDRRIVTSGNVTEWWALGVCRLRRVRKGPWMELYADRGKALMRDTGKIAFKTWDEPHKPPVREVPPEPDTPDWAE